MADQKPSWMDADTWRKLQEDAHEAEEDWQNFTEVLPPGFFDVPRDQE